MEQADGMCVVGPGELDARAVEAGDGDAARLQQVLHAGGGGARGREHAPEHRRVLLDARRADEQRAVTDVSRAQHEARHLGHERREVRVAARDARRGGGERGIECGVGEAAGGEAGAAHGRAQHLRRRDVGGGLEVISRELAEEALLVRVGLGLRASVRNRARVRVRVRVRGGVRVRKRRASAPPPSAAARARAQKARAVLSTRRFGWKAKPSSAAARFSG